MTQKVKKAGGSTTMRESIPQGSSEPPKLPFVGILRPQIRLEMLVQISTKDQLEQWDRQ